ncbi:MAG: VanZ family protein [Gemmatimonadota bacterium]
MNAARPPGWRLLVVSAAAIGIATLVPTGGSGTTASGCILCGHRGLSDFISNILLFAPLGFALGRRGQPLLRAAAIGAAYSLGIELAQMDLIPGRDANLGDLVANSLGAVAGWGAGFRRGWWTRSGSDTGRCLGAAAATAVLLLGALALFAPSLPDSTYYMQWTARFGNMAAYDGRVLSTRIGPLDIPGRQRIEQTDSVRELLFGQPLEIVAVAASPPDIAPIVSIYDDRQRQIMLLGAERADLIYRYRMLADELLLDHGDLRVHQAFERVEPGTTFRLRWVVDRRGYCLELDGRSECGRGFTVGDTWTLLMALDWGTDERAVLRALWLWGIFLPAGFLARRARTLAAAGLLAALLLLAGPLLLGFAATPVHQVAAALMGLLTGRLAAWRSAFSDHAGQRV